MLQYPDTIVATAVEEKVAKKLHKHLSSFGLDPTSLLDEYQLIIAGRNIII